MSPKTAIVKRPDPGLVSVILVKGDLKHDRTSRAIRSKALLFYVH